MTNMNEDEHQATILEWCALNRNKYPELDLLYHIPNEGKRSPATAATMKRIGLKSGVPDLCLPVARGGYHGLYIELKADGGRVTKKQMEWIDRLQQQHYCAVVCFGWEAAVKAIERYCKGVPKRG